MRHPFLGWIGQQGYLGIYTSQLPTAGTGIGESCQTIDDFSRLICASSSDINELHTLYLYFN